MTETWTDRLTDRHADIPLDNVLDIITSDGIYVYKKGRIFYRTQIILKINN